MTPNQEDVDRMARELYQHGGYCGGCRHSLTLAEQLQGRCPHCGAVILAGPDITPERGRARLDSLKRRRVELGLSEGVAGKPDNSIRRAQSRT